VKFWIGWDSDGSAVFHKREPTWVVHADQFLYCDGWYVDGNIYESLGSIEIPALDDPKMAGELWEVS